MDYQNITVHQEDRVARVVMCRPECRNALSEPHLRELLHAFRGIGEGACRGAILAARGPVFCSGHDFADMEGRGLAEMRRLLGVCRELMQTLQSIPQPVVAQVEGLATAAGCQLVASCDLAVAGESTRFAVPGGKGGMFCTTPGVALTRAVGRKRAFEMLVTGDEIDAHTAADWGLINRVVPDAEVPEQTRALLARATRGSALSKGLGKQAFYQQIELDTRAAYDLASEAMAAASQTDDAREGMRAFLDKRRPQFSDR